MTMKPSKRIVELAAGLNPQLTPMEQNVLAIVNYLDEEWEKNKPCKHESSYQVDNGNDVYYNVCNDCGVLFLASK